MRAQIQRLKVIAKQFLVDIGFLASEEIINLSVRSPMAEIATTTSDWKGSRPHCKGIQKEEQERSKTKGKGGFVCLWSLWVNGTTKSRRRRSSSDLVVHELKDAGFIL